MTSNTATKVRVSPIYSVTPLCLPGLLVDVDESETILTEADKRDKTGV